MRHLTSATAAVGAAVMTLSAFLAPAAAETRGVHDRAGDAPSGIDVTRVSYRNHPDFVSARIHVADLTRRPLRFIDFVFFQTQEQDDGASAGAWIDEDGDLRTMLSHQPDDQGKVSCRFEVRWRAARDVVLIRVPRRCIAAAHVRDTGRLRLYVTTATVERDGDRTDPVVLRRG